MRTVTMIKMKRCVPKPVLTAVFFGLAIAALTAPGAVMAQGTPEQRQACTGDAMRLCGHTIPDPGRTKACLIGNRRMLSPACRTAFGGGGKVIKRKAKRSRRG
jgi:hypothetical protein